MEFPWHNKRSLRLRGPTKRALRLLLAPSVNLSDLHHFNILASLFDARTYSTSGARYLIGIQKYISDLMIRAAGERHPRLLEHIIIRTDIRMSTEYNSGFPCVPPLKHLDFAMLGKVKDYLAPYGYLPYSEWLRRVTTIYLSLAIPGDRVDSHTTIWEVGKRFSTLIRSINQTKYDPKHGPMPLEGLLSALRWKRESIFIKDNRLVRLTKAMEDPVLQEAADSFAEWLGD